MPPVDTTPQAAIRYLTRLLAAIITEHDGELRIKRKHLREIEDETSRQALFEDVDSQKDEIVLRFGSKHSAIYPVEAECRAVAPTQPTVRTPQVPQPQKPQTPPSTAPGSTLPFNEEQLQKAEKEIARQRMLHSIRRENPTPR